VTADLEGTRERDPADVWVLDERLAGLLADPVDQVQHARRQADLLEHLDEERGEERGVLGRLEDAGAPADDRRGDLPEWNRDREVPRRDQPDPPDRMTNRHRELAAELGWHGVPERPAPLPRHVMGEVDALLNVAA
jgi:ParB family chromosome partitioning protein